MPSSSKDTTGVAPSKEARKVKRTGSSSTRRESEPGGVPLPQEKSPEPATSGGSRRRRPRKLGNQEKEAVRDVSETRGPKPGKTDLNNAGISSEVEVLKSKVKEIEAQVQEILLRPPPGPRKSARRRQRSQKGKTQSRVEEEQGQADKESPERSSESRKDLEKLQKELEEAQGELAGLRAKKSTPRTEEGEVEDIPRLERPGLEVHRPRPLGRSVTLSGNYRIPLPVEVSDADLDAIGRGIRSAQSIARTFLDSESNRERPKREHSSGSWSEWLGGYSMSIARAVSNVQLVSNIETTPQRPVIQGRAETAPPRKRPPKLERRNKRPDIGRGLSEAEVEGLLA